MKFEQQYKKYLGLFGKRDEFSTGSPVDYTRWLESLVSDNEIEIDVRGGVAECVHYPRHIRVYIRDYDNTEAHDGSEQEYSEDMYGSNF